MEDNMIHPLAKFLRLQNGDDLIAETIETEDEHGIIYTVFNPLKVVYLPSETAGFLSVAFTPWVFPRICDQQEFCIHGEDVLLVADVTEKMNIYYWDSVEVAASKSYGTPEEIAEETQQEPEPVEEDSALAEALEQLGINKRTYH